MRARTGDPPRTMCQKILAGHESGTDASARLIEVRVDQVALSREPTRVLEAAIDAGLKKSQVEVAAAYPPRCVTTRDANDNSSYRLPQDAVALGLTVAQPGAGFASAIHFERFASPFRLLLTDEPRLAHSGAAGMLSLPASRSQLCRSEERRVGKEGPAGC